MYNTQLADRVRNQLAGSAAEMTGEKKMFRGMAFMVNGKLCISAGDDELMFRFDPALHDRLAKQEGCRHMLRNGKPMKGYMYVHSSRLKTKNDLQYWMDLALAYNPQAQAAKKTKR